MVCFDLKMAKVLLIVTWVFFIYSVESSIVPFITKCEWNDDDCHIKSTIAAIPTFADGYPELGLEPLDPLVIESIDASSPNLEFKVHNAKITGLKNCEPKNIHREKDGPKLFVEFLCSADVNSEYELKGQLLVLSLHGKGKLVAKINKCLFKAEINLTEKVKDGKKYFSIKSFSSNFELQDQSYLHFENLVPLSKDLQSTMDDLIAQSSNDIIMEIGQPIVKEVFGKVVKVLSHFLKKVPYEDLILS